MSDTPHRPAAPDRSDELVETGNPALDPLGRPAGSDQTTVGNVRPRAPTVADIPTIPGYEIVEKVGEGGMGTVFRATKLSLDRVVALKTMRAELAAVPENRERFLREARAAAAVESEFIVQIRHVDQAADGTPFIEMEFLKGQPLDARLKAEARCPLGVILKVGREVAAGLAAAHAAGLVHRDIKPGNVWLERSPAHADPFARCKILDFGLARRSVGDAQLTTPGAIVGTPAYMAPEQAHGHEVDHRADLWSLGVVLYRMATGQLPFKGDSPMAVLVAVTTETPRSVKSLAPDLPEELLDLIDRLMCKAPAGRPQTAAEVAGAVAEIERRVTANEPLSLVLDRGPAPDAGTITFREPVPPGAEGVPRTARDRFTELVGVVALVPLVTAACVGLWLALGSTMTWALAARAFVPATALAWVVALVARVPVRGGWRRWVRYAVQFAAGASIGALALWCDGWAASGGAASVGAQYALYFGLAACACRWWWDRLRAFCSSREERRFRASWNLIRAPLTVLALLVAWPNQFAPLEHAVLILFAALAAQIARPLARPAAGAEEKR